MADEEFDEETETHTDEEGEVTDPEEGSEDPRADEEEVPPVDDEGERPDVDWDEDAPDIPSGEEPDNTPPVEPDPVPETRYKTVTRKTVEVIHDFSAESLQAYQDSGAKAYAVYDDGTRVEVPWSEVSDPSPADVEVAYEAGSVAIATNQHFWHNSDQPETHGGAGVHVTDETQDEWKQAVADGFPDLSDSKPHHNVLINSLGILLRSALRNLVSITRSAIAFFDGDGNDTENVVAYFGNNGARIGKESSGRYVDIDDDEVAIYSGSKVETLIHKIFVGMSAHIGADRFIIRSQNQMGENDNFSVTQKESDNNLIVTKVQVSPTSLEQTTAGQVEVGKHGEGFEVSGTDSMSVGHDNSVAGENSLAFGLGLIASKDQQVVMGRFNVEDTDDNYALIIGNGDWAYQDPSKRSNAFTVDWDGNVECAGNVTANGQDLTSGIYSITRNGTTFTATRIDGSTFTFTQQDNDTKDLGSMTGTLSIAHGGTGKTTAADAWTALGGGSIGKKNSLAASDIPNHSTDKLTSGTLPIGRGGTGATTASGAIKSLTGREWDFGTADTTNTWVPVAASVDGVAKWRHRAIPTNLATTPTSLWSGDSNGNITLSQSAANFTRITIYFRDNDSQYNSVDVYSPNGKTVILMTNWQAQDHKMRTVKFNGTALNTINAYHMSILNSSHEQKNLIYIIRVLGWKY